MSDRIEEFQLEGKDFMHIDLSGFYELAQYMEIVHTTIPMIAKYPESSLYTITDIHNIKFDTAVKNEIAKWVKQNAPHVKFGAIFGVDGIKKIMINSIFQLSGRKNMKCFNTKEQAIEWLLKQ